MDQIEKWRRLREWIRDYVMSQPYPSAEKTAMQSVLEKMRSLDDQEREEGFFRERFDGED